MLLREVGPVDSRVKGLGQDVGWPDRVRTCDISVNSGTLCQLSYWPT